MPALALALALALAAASSCSSPRKGKTLAIYHPGGFVGIGNGNITLMQAEFWKSVSPEPTPTFVSIGDDHCETLSVSSASSAGITFADVGSELTFTSASHTLVVAETTTEGLMFFNQLAPYVPGDETWTVTNSGGADLAASTIGTIHTPTAAVVTSAPSLTPGASATVTWTGGKNADAVDIGIQGDTSFVDCSAKPDGSFTIPASATTAAGPNAAILNVVPMTEHIVRINGRDLQFIGATY